MKRIFIPIPDLQTGTTSKNHCINVGPMSFQYWVSIEVSTIAGECLYSLTSFCIINCTVPEWAWVLSTAKFDIYVRDFIKILQNINYSRLSISRSRRDPLKHFEIAVLRHIRFTELRKIPIEQPNFTNEHVIWLFLVMISSYPHYFVTWY